MDQLPTKRNLVVDARAKSRAQSRLFTSRFFAEALEMQSEPPYRLPPLTWVAKDLSEKEISALRSQSEQQPVKIFSKIGSAEHDPAPTQQSFSNNQKRVGVYYMNLDRSPGRRDYTEQMFKKYLSETDYDFIRVAGVDMRNTTSLRNALGLDPSQDVEDHIRSLCPKGSFGPTVTYFTAMARAYEDGHDIALIMEDDASFEFVPHWPKTIRELAAEITAADPDWEAVRLSYIAAPVLRGAHLVLQEWKSQYPNLPAFQKWKNLAAMKRLRLHKGNVRTALAGPLYDTLSILWSRKGLRRLVSEHVVLNGKVPAHVGHPNPYIVKFDHKDFKKAESCTIDIYLNKVDLNQYIATPPYFTFRLAEGSLGQRGSGKDRVINDHSQIHGDARLFATQFNNEAMELRYFPPSSLGQFKWETESIEAMESYEYAAIGTVVASLGIILLLLLILLHSPKRILLKNLNSPL